MLIQMLLVLVVFVFSGTHVSFVSAADTATRNEVSAADQPAGGEGIPGWRGADAVREDLAEAGGFLDFSLGWVLVFFVLSAALLIWLAWQNRHGGMWGGSGSEKIELVARRMFGSKHGVVCVRLRDREFFLGIGGDSITLISEWRRRPDSGEEGRHDETANSPSPADPPGGRP